MGYRNEWLLLETEDEMDEIEHRPPTEEFLFYQAVTNGNMDAVRKNCEQERFLDSEGVGVLSKNPLTNLISFCYHNGYDHTSLQTEGNGAGTGISDE